MSNKKFGENPNHRKSKVSWALLVSPGLGGPKFLPKGKNNGQTVNIPSLILASDGMTFL